MIRIPPSPTRHSKYPSRTRRRPRAPPPMSSRLAPRPAAPTDTAGEHPVVAGDRAYRGRDRLARGILRRWTGAAVTHLEGDVAKINDHYCLQIRLSGLKLSRSATARYSDGDCCSNGQQAARREHGEMG